MSSPMQFRLAMSWPQACVSAYYVAYAENPHSTRFDCTIPAQDSSSSFPIAKLAEKVFKILFYLHLFLIAVLVIYLTIYGLVYASHSYHLYPKQWYWYPPLLIATLCAGIVGFTWQWITVRYTTKAIGAAFCLSPLLTSAMGVRFVHIGSSPSLALGIVSLVSALIQAIYGFWVSPRFDYANRILSASISDPPTKSMRLAFYSTLIGILYCCFLVCGIGGARAIEKNIVATSLFILVILLSLGWTMQFLKNVLQVTISRVKYMHLSGGVIMDNSVALHDTINYQTGSVSFGSILVPFISLFRGSARLTSLIRGDADVLVFAYARCYMQLASALVACGNRWGFVHVGVYNKGFVQASSDTWDIFNRVGLKQLLDRSH
ncbi:hypothetical protein Fmac_016337 [Flemingia macrophylla]|uniref:Choline transporter-like protein n=1 Tax=Flemingia macrophylla TaxID=520843 RepID=A0ABD1MH54_9FABA